MHAPAWQALRAVASRSKPTGCRFLGGRRYPSPRRSFRISHGRAHENDPSGKAQPPEAVWINVAEDVAAKSKDEAAVPENEEVAESPGGSSPGASSPKDRSGYGSASRRASRNLRKKEIPPPQLPQWFFDRNVRLREVGSQTGDGTPLEDGGPVDTSRSILSQSDHHPQSESESVSQPTDSPAKPPASDLTPEQPATNPIYTVDEHVLKEIIATVSAGLRPSHDANAAAARSHLILHCPQDGGTYFLEGVINHVASLFEADVIRLDAQDIAEIGGRYIPDFKDSSGNTLSALGYEAYLTTTMRGPQENEYPDEEEEMDDEEGADDSRQPTPTPFPKSSVGIVPIAQFSGNFSDIFKNLSSFITPSAPRSPQSSSAGQTRPSVLKVLEAPDTTINAKTSLLVETLLNASDTKRAVEAKTSDSLQNLEDPAIGHDSLTVKEETHVEQPAIVPASDVGLQPKNVLVVVRDYQEISLTRNGHQILEQLHEIVQRRRREGQRIVIVGTTSAKDLIPSLSKSGIRHVQSEQGNGSTRTIVTPSTATPAESTFAQQAKVRLQDINIRHLQDMLCRITPDPSQIHIISTATDLQSEIDSGIIFTSGLDETVWSMDRVHRVATLALGLLHENKEMAVEDVEQALTIIDSSDNSKFSWVEKEREEEKNKEKKGNGPFRKDGPSSADIDERLKKLRRTCNSHEKKLLHGVVDPENIRTTFADVRATPETIEALKTLTSLSLVRPDAFTYGVLATDRIPGLLLYGPPGTGKTLLAKAVAKESGATVLEVSGSDVYDMYVGEGEKNIRAIFTLAKKLTPCIVFIDEADAILGSRGGAGNRTTHRELINQFLREWDGMTDMNAFIMVATNRPFDLDEASLRRLPRRLLVDLPTEKDREAILGIHLKNEILHPDIDLATLASQTPFYSGSDLKNLCVAAALACVREEFDNAAAAKGNPEGYKYPEKRTLEQRHFDRGMDEISASISEDMGSLSAIRKFDEKYGDRRGRRKRGGGYGFGTIKESERNVDGSARVRNQT